MARASMLGSGLNSEREVTAGIDCQFRCVIQTGKIVGGVVNEMRVDYYSISAQCTQFLLSDPCLHTSDRSELTSSFCGRTTRAVQKSNCQQQLGIQNPPRFRSTSEAGDDI